MSKGGRGQTNSSRSKRRGIKGEGEREAEREGERKGEKESEGGEGRDKEQKVDAGNTSTGLQVFADRPHMFEAIQ